MVGLRVHTLQKECYVHLDLQMPRNEQVPGPPSLWFLSTKRNAAGLCLSFRSTAQIYGIGKIDTRGGSLRCGGGAGARASNTTWARARFSSP